MNIDLICKEYVIENYTINSDGSIDVDGSVNLVNKGLTKLPLRFRNVSGYFACNKNQLSTLEGCPQSIDGSFDCSNNKLKTLIGAPQSVGGSFSCDRNQLITLEGAPQSVGSGFYCYNNQLKTLEGAPQSVGGSFSCIGNQLTTLIGAPQSVGNSFYCNGNPIYDEIMKGNEDGILEQDELNKKINDILNDNRKEHLK